MLTVDADDSSGAVALVEHGADTVAVVVHACVQTGYHRADICADLNVVLLLDTSASMVHGTRMVHMKSMACVVLDSLPAGSNFAIAAFSNGLEFIAGRPPQEDAAFACVPLVDEARVAAKAAILNLRAYGATRLNSAFVELARHAGPLRVLLLTDGEVHNVNAVLRTVRAAQCVRGMQVHALALGKQPSPALIQGVASSSSGTWAYIDVEGADKDLVASVRSMMPHVECMLLPRVGQVHAEVEVDADKVVHATPVLMGSGLTITLMLVRVAQQTLSIRARAGPFTWQFVVQLKQEARPAQASCRTVHRYVTSARCAPGHVFAICQAVWQQVATTGQVTRDLLEQAIQSGVCAPGASMIIVDAGAECAAAGGAECAAAGGAECAADYTPESRAMRVFHAVSGWFGVRRRLRDSPSCALVPKAELPSALELMELVCTDGMVAWDSVVELHMPSPDFLRNMDALVAQRPNSIVAAVVVLVLLRRLHSADEVLWSLCARRAYLWLCKTQGSATLDYWLDAGVRI